MRFTIVSETYPPEVNGVALTVHALKSGLHGHLHSRRDGRVGMHERRHAAAGCAVTAHIDEGLVRPATQGDGA